MGRQKDVNDLVLLLESGSEFAWTAPLAEIERVGLGRFWNALIDHVTTSSALSDEASARARSLRFEGLTPEEVALGTSSWDERCQATVEHAYQVGVSRNGHTYGLQMAENAHRYYTEQLQLKMTESCGHGREHQELLTNLRNDTCVRLVPLNIVRSLAHHPVTPAENTSEARSIPGSSLLSERTAGEHSFVSAGGGFFAPMIFYNLCSVQASFDGVS
ncbi:hypothetical protein ACIBK9_28685 [Nonomuraea sp. NPDC050227]|uniref:hypothetical protein n=1 Tax=Nonomuraea sp. NPDC050227 TaxID=3364360 RepID=UPI0037A13B35